MSNSFDAAFQEVSGLDSAVEIEDVREGGINSYVHKLPGLTKHTPLTLKRGYMNKESPLALWVSQCIGADLGSPLQLHTLTIRLLGGNGQALMVWTLHDAWPLKWEVGMPDAVNSNAVLTETLELAYNTVTTTSMST